jgi:cytochrome c2
MRWHILGCALVVACLLGTPIRAQESELAEGKQRYEEQCSRCHGMVESDAKHYRPDQPLWQQRYTWQQRLDMPWLTLRAAYHAAPSPRLTRYAPVAFPLPADSRGVAVALPYGPLLRGVYGRQAGSVPGFAYSRAFKTALEGVVWERGTLNVWIMDSQGWVSGSTMFYKQPDADIRRKIITYLEAHR